MPTFDTPEPISVTLEIVAGDTRVVATDRTDTVVEVRPRNASRSADRKLSEATRVEYAEGRLLVKTPALSGFLVTRTGAIDVTIELPTGSRVRGRTATGGLHAEGSLGECDFRTSSGDITLHEGGPLHLTTYSGRIEVDHAGGDVEAAGAGRVRIGEIDGTGRIKNINGSTEIGSAAGDLRLNSANGDIDLGQTNATVKAKTANGNIRIREIVRGDVVIDTASGALEIGVRDSTTAWLDVHSSSGNVSIGLDPSEAPTDSGDVVKVRARTASGDIRVHRATAAA
jgi:DUF4097 and DUF4098 domain-containing protein YvlB